jgi:hypothetical protein
MIEDAISSHTCLFEASMHVANGIRWTLPLTVATVNYAGTLKALKGCLVSTIYFCSRRQKRNCCTTICSPCRGRAVRARQLMMDDDDALVQYGSSDEESEDEPDGMYGGSTAVTTGVTSVPISNRGLREYSSPANSASRSNTRSYNAVV